MRIAFAGWGTLVVLLSTMFARAEPPPRGFLLGPYLQMVAGARSADDDVNLVTGGAVGRSVEPMFGFQFGWHILDSLGVDFSGFYTSLGSGTSQQHLITSRMDGLWNPLITPIVASPRARVLPFVLGGITAQITILPSADQTVAARVTQWGVGPNIGGGVGVLCHHDQIFLSARAVVDWVHRNAVYQPLGGVDTLVYQGGWSTQWNTMLGVGVHF